MALMSKTKGTQILSAQSRGTRAGKAEPSTWCCQQRQPASGCPSHSQLRQIWKHPFWTEERHHYVPHPKILNFTGCYFQIPPSFNFEQKMTKEHSCCLQMHQRHMNPSLKAPWIVQMSSQSTLCNK